MPEVLTETEKKPARRYPDMAEVFSGMERRAERQQLERAVIEAAKGFTSNDEARDNWDALVAYRKLCRAVDALLDFESQNKE